VRKGGREGGREGGRGGGRNELRGHVWLLVGVVDEVDGCVGIGISFAGLGENGVQYKEEAGVSGHWRQGNGGLTSSEHLPALISLNRNSSHLLLPLLSFPLLLPSLPPAHTVSRSGLGRTRRFGKTCSPGSIHGALTDNREGGREGGREGRDTSKWIRCLDKGVGVSDNAALPHNPLTLPTLPPSLPHSLLSVIQKLYLRWMDTGASGEALLKILEETNKKVEEVVVAEVAAAAAAAAAAGGTEEGKEGGGEEDEHVNEGGNGGVSTTTTTTSLTEEQEQQQQQQQQKAEEKEERRKSRWGGGEGEAGTTTTAAAAAAGTETKRRSRWGDAGATVEAGKKKSRYEARGKTRENKERVCELVSSSLIFPLPHLPHLPPSLPPSPPPSLDGANPRPLPALPSIQIPYKRSLPSNFAWTTSTSAR